MYIQFSRFIFFCAQAVFLCSAVFFIVVLTETSSFVPRAATNSFPVYEGDSSSILPWEHYAGIFKSRDLFSPIEAKPKVSLSGIPLFRVAGLMLGRRNSVVLQGPGRGTLFLAEGERQGGIIVQKIGKDRVALEIAGEPLILEMKGQM